MFIPDNNETIMKTNNLPNNNQRAQEYLNAQRDALIELQERIVYLDEEYEIEREIKTMINEIKEELE